MRRFVIAALLLSVHCSVVNGNEPGSEDRRDAAADVETVGDGSAEDAIPATDTIGDGGLVCGGPMDCGNCACDSNNLNCPFNVASSPPPARRSISNGSYTTAVDATAKPVRIA
jgi:hypothetical protein